MVERLDSEQKVARKGIQAHFQARLFSSANLTRDSQESHFLITFFLNQEFEGAWIVVEDRCNINCKQFAQKEL